MAKAENLLGTVRQVATTEEEHVFKISTRKLRNYAIFAGVILVFVSSLIVYVVLKHRGADSVVGSSDKGAVSQPVNGVESETAAAKPGEGIVLETGPFSEKEFIKMSAGCIVQIIERERPEVGMNIGERMDYKSGVVKYLRKERTTDNNGIKRDIHVVDIHLVGTYGSIVRGEPDKPFDIFCTAYVIKINHGDGFKIVGIDNEVINFNS